MSKYLIVALALALVASVTVSGGYAYQYARQASALETALASNKLLGEALDNSLKQRKIDDAKVVEFTRAINQLNAAFDQQEEALRELNNDPTAKNYLDTPVPDNVRKLFVKP